MASIAAIASRLREGIRIGTWAAGAALPPRSRLAAELHCSQRTLQAAIRSLVAEGLVICRDRAATSIQPGDAVRRHIAVLLLPRRGGAGWSRLDRLVDLQARQYRGDRFRFSCFAGLAHPDGDHRALRSALLAGTFSAAILRGEPDESAALVKHLRPLPAVAIGVRNRTVRLPCLHLPHLALIASGLDRLLSRGVRRPMVITYAGLPTLTRGIAALLAQRRVGGDGQVLELPPDHDRGATQIVRLLLGLPAATRPDGLLVGIDSLAPAVARALADDPAAARGMRLMIHDNLPRCGPLAWPCERIGFDIGALLVRAADLATAPPGTVTAGARIDATPITDWTSDQAET